MMEPHPDEISPRSSITPMDDGSVILHLVPETTQWLVNIFMGPGAAAWGLLTSGSIEDMAIAMELINLFAEAGQGIDIVGYPIEHIARGMLVSAAVSTGRTREEFLRDVTIQMNEHYPDIYEKAALLMREEQDGE